MRIPFLKPNPPRLSENLDRLRAIEDSGVFSNFGPVNTAFELDLIDRLFDGQGGCTTVCNATIGLMLAVQHAIGKRPTQRRYALMPAFTFPAAAQAALWCGLTPLFCDIDPDTWAACAADEKRLLDLYGQEIAVVLPYATFGYDIDLSRYSALKARYGVPVVIDAAASLGTISANGRGFGAGFDGSIVFSMHATKSFATGEAGLIYSGNPNTVRTLRQMCNFGFGAPRTATMPGLNGKLGEIGALLGQLRLADYDTITTHRDDMLKRYRQALPDLTFQSESASRQSHQFAPALLPRDLASSRAAITAALMEDGIGSASYFSPHLMQQEYFVEQGVSAALPVTDDVSARMISLPLFDTMSVRDLDEVATSVRRVLSKLSKPVARRQARRLLPLNFKIGVESQTTGEIRSSICNSSNIHNDNFVSNRNRAFTRD